MYCCSTVRKKEILSFVTIWMELEGIALSELNQRRTDPARYHYMWNLKKKKKSNSEKQGVEKGLPRAAGLGKW